MRAISFFLFSTALFFSTNSFSQQIGINTKTPKTGTTLHIDSQGNTSADNTTNTTDDVVVMSDGRLGIGTTSPSDITTGVKVEVDGQFRLRQGAALEKILMTDANGNASWQSFSLGDFSSEFVVESPFLTIPSGNIYKVQTIATFRFNQLELKTDGTSSLTIPPGRYLISLSNNLTYISASNNLAEFNEYVKVYLYRMDPATGNVYTPELFYCIYGIDQPGASMFLNFTQETTLCVAFEAINTGTGVPYVAPLPYNPPADAIYPFLVMRATIDVLRIQGF
ncbi:hypothetical protein [Dysgonomonas sp. GY617]|uniref:hypothetical protein n=1 Tax=Dysgonomonas sp. GY617 TaxID=2780420 RepID=UPI0018842607|nr:hypothetical protein [Dysgonomonas sp. GY617]MBF0577145.1 hypothetical protein [Dysgonomonas sp. GY617]